MYQDSVCEKSKRTGRSLPTLGRLLHQPQGRSLKLEVGAVLEQKPRGVRPLLSNIANAGPSVRFDDLAQPACVNRIDGEHLTEYHGVSERGPREALSHRLVCLLHRQKLFTDLFPWRHRPIAASDSKSPQNDEPDYSHLHVFRAYFT
jgi:hypothetical protein